MQTTQEAPQRQADQITSTPADTPERPTVWSLFCDWQGAYHAHTPESDQQALDDWATRTCELERRIATTPGTSLFDIRAKLMLLRHWEEEGSTSDFAPYALSSAIADILAIETKELRRRCACGSAAQ